MDFGIAAAIDFDWASCNSEGLWPFVVGPLNEMKINLIGVSSLPVT